MIEINLLSGGKKKKGGGGGINLSAIRDMVSQVKDPLLLGAVGAWVAAIALAAGVWYFQSQRLQLMEPELQQVRTEARQFQTLIAEKRRMETLRDSLLAELVAIRSIDGDRYVWPHILEEVTKALPDFTWLVALNVVRRGPDDTDAAVRFGLDGRTSDIQAFTRFQRQLSNSPWLTDITFGQTQQVIEQERMVRAFRIEASFRHADSAFVRTAPVTQLLQ